MNIENSLGYWRCSTCKFNNNGLCMGWRLSNDAAESLRKPLASMLLMKLKVLRELILKNSPSLELYVLYIHQKDSEFLISIDN